MRKHRQIPWQIPDSGLAGRLVLIRLGEPKGGPIPFAFLSYGFDPRNHTNFNFTDTCRRQDRHIGIPIPLD